MSSPDLEAKYAAAISDRNQHTDAILDSKSRKIIVVAGPGTGKTALFAQLLRRRSTNSLTLSFINALVDDLSLSLAGLSDVDTLHGFAAKRLKAKIYPKLPSVIRSDAEILLKRPSIEYETMFQQCEGDEHDIEFYKRRKRYYGNYYGFADAIYGLVRYLEAHPERVPSFDQLVVDEFQDFNKAEVTLIDLLAQRSPVLLAGDDDQALYAGLKGASAEFIRKRFEDSAFGYERRHLPYCSRSTEVIVSAVNDIVVNGIKKGLLKGRVSKPFKYFPCEMKDRESKASPGLVYAQRFEGQLADFIQRELHDAACRGERERFSVLVICPPLLRKTSLPKMEKALRKRGFRNIVYSEATASREPTILEGLEILLSDKDSNLGWRIVAIHMASPDRLATIVKNAVDETRFSDLLSADERKQSKRLLRTLRQIRDGKSPNSSDLSSLMEKIGWHPEKMAADALRDELVIKESARQGVQRAVRNLPITLTTVPSSKGLAADYVFVTHFDDFHYANGDSGEVTDDNVFSLLVALTRAKKRAFLVSCKPERPALLGWIDAGRVEHRLTPDSA